MADRWWKPRTSRPRKDSRTLEAWRHVAEAIGGDVEHSEDGKPHRLIVPHRDWTLTLENYTVSTGSTSATYPRVRALFVREAPFSLRVTKRNPFHVLARLVGIREVQVSYGPLDRTLFVRSDDPTLARSILRGTDVGQALLVDPALRLDVTRPGQRIRKITGETIGEVRVQTGGKERDVTRLRSMLRLCADTLEQLARFGAAGEAPVERVSI
ncbi:MAG: hypothetical protein ACRELC_14075 [Gemmatimonadota bacterium]